MTRSCDEEEDSIVDIEGISDDEVDAADPEEEEAEESCSVIETSDSSEPQNRIRTLAEHIIAAIPDRYVKNCLLDSVLGCESRDLKLLK